MHRQTMHWTALNSSQLHKFAGGDAHGPACRRRLWQHLRPGAGWSARGAVSDARFQHAARCGLCAGLPIVPNRDAALRVGAAYESLTLSQRPFLARVAVAPSNVPSTNITASVTSCSSSQRQADNSSQRHAAVCAVLTNRQQRRLIQTHALHSGVPPSESSGAAGAGLTYRHLCVACVRLLPPPLHPCRSSHDHMPVAGGMHMCRASLRWHS